MRAHEVVGFTPPPGAPLAADAGDNLLEFLGLPGSEAWRTLLGKKLLEDVCPAIIIDYVAACWRIRRAALTGREADGGNPMALASVPAPDSAA